MQKCEEGKENNLNSSKHAGICTDFKRYVNLALDPCHLTDTGANSINLVSYKKELRYDIL